MMPTRLFTKDLLTFDIVKTTSATLQSVEAPFMRIPRNPYIFDGGCFDT
jgi:hypothetical protein